jgi:cardiolipin synthase (CMP-forming)
VSLAALPNIICVARMVLTVPVGLSILDGDYGLAFTLCMVAALSDILDGWLAKHFGWTTELGKVLDPVADKLFMLTVFVTLMVTDVTPLWLGAVAILRDVVIGAGAWTYKVLFGPVEGHPTAISKVNTGFQLAYVMAAIGASASWFPDWLPVWLGAAMFVTTVASGVDYTAHYIRKAKAVSRARRGAG